MYLSMPAILTYASDFFKDATIIQNGHRLKVD